MAARNKGHEVTCIARRYTKYDSAVSPWPYQTLPIRSVNKSAERSDVAKVTRHGLIWYGPDTLARGLMNLTPPTRRDRWSVSLSFTLLM
jgi:hypothetical protein